MQHDNASIRSSAARLFFLRPIILIQPSMGFVIWLYISPCQQGDKNKICFVASPASDMLLEEHDYCWVSACSVNGCMGS